MVLFYAVFTSLGVLGGARVEGSSFLHGATRLYSPALSQVLKDFVPSKQAMFFIDF